MNFPFRAREEMNDQAGFAELVRPEDDRVGLNVRHDAEL
jgi:hypothetical protein